MRFLTLFQRVFLIINCLLWVMPAATATPLNSKLQTPPTYSTITSESGWLNTERALKADDLKGRIILLDFWTYCCINCIHVMPDLKYLEEKFGNDLTVIGVHSAKFKNEKDSENIKNAILRHDLTHPVVNDADFKIWKKFGVKSWPTFILISPKGIVAEVYSGEGHRAELEQAIEKIRQEYADDLNRAPLPIALEKEKMPETVLKFPAKLAVYPVFTGSKNPLVISDSGHHRIVLVSVEDERIIETVGSGKPGFKDGSFDEAEFRFPQGVLVGFGSRDYASPDGMNSPIYVADTGNHAIRKIDFKTRTVKTVAGTGVQGYERNLQNAKATQTAIASPWDLAFYPDYRRIVIAMAGTHQLVSYDTEKQTLSVVAGSGVESIEDGGYPDNSLSQPSGLAVSGSKLYFVDAETSSLRVLENGEVKTLIGSGLFDFGYADGVKGKALMQHPLGVFADMSGVYIADSYNHAIRRYDPVTGKLENYAGHGVRGKQDGSRPAADFNEPGGLVKTSGALYVADTNNHAIRAIDLESGRVDTLTIHEAAVENAITPNEDLPNLEPMKPMVVAVSLPVRVTLAMQPGWKINADAPSYLDLFAGNRHVAGFELKDIKPGEVMLPALAAGEYRLQGTLYYCEDKAGSQCLIKSFDVTLNAAASGQAGISLRLN